ncbi:MAG TPA: hypothetical protein DIC42_04690 [Holosporales bacterium]|nr:hypothetical protein [Holosporales bacterium]
MLFSTSHKKPVFLVLLVIPFPFLVNPLFSVDDLLIRKNHVSETFLTGIKEELPIVMARADYRERIKGYLSSGGNSNLSFPRTITDRHYEWGFLHLAVGKASARSREEMEEQDRDVELVRFLIGKVNINHKDSNERTALHLAAYSGPGRVIEVLLQEGKAYPLYFDKLYLLPSDYHVLAHVFNDATVYSHPILMASEKSAEKRLSETHTTKEKAAFIRSFEESCSSTQLSYALLGARILAKDKATFSVSGFLNLISDVLPSPIALGTQGLALVADLAEQNLEEKSRQKYVSNFQRIFNKETAFRNTAHFLANRYELFIQALTEQGAADLGDYAAEKVNDYLQSEQCDGFRFVAQIEAMLANIEKDAFLQKKVKLKQPKGSKSEVCAWKIFNIKQNRTLLADREEIPAMPVGVGYRYDKEEEERLNALVRIVDESAPTTAVENVSIREENIKPVDMLDFSQLSLEKSLVDALRNNYTPQQAETVISLNLAHQHITSDVAASLNQFSNLQSLNLTDTRIEQEALQKMEQLSLNHLLEVDWRRNASIAINKPTLVLLSRAVDALNRTASRVQHLFDNDTLNKLGHYHEENGDIEKALGFYESGTDAFNKLAFVKLSTQRSTNDDHAFSREYRCLSDLVAMHDSHGQYMMAYLYKNAKADTLRKLRALNVVSASMNENEAKEDLKSKAIDLYKLAAEIGGHTRAAKALAQMYDARKPQLFAPRPSGGHQTSRCQLEEELKYWRIAAQGQRSVLEGAKEYVESAPENISRIEMALNQLMQQ